MSTIIIMILWTWKLTPVWVNIIGTAICLFRIAFNAAKLMGDEK